MYLPIWTESMRVFIWYTKALYIYFLLNFDHCNWAQQINEFGRDLVSSPQDLNFILYLRGVEDSKSLYSFYLLDN